MIWRGAAANSHSRQRETSQPKGARGADNGVGYRNDQCDIYRRTNLRGRLQTDFIDSEDARLEFEKDFAALDTMSKARHGFERRICAASRCRDEEGLEAFRGETTFEFARFFFSVAARGLNGPDDARILADLHNHQLDALLKDKRALRRRGLRADRLPRAIFTSDTQPRLEQIWREKPGALDQSNLARFLVRQMSSETTRKLVEAGAEARNRGVFDRRHGKGARRILARDASRHQATLTREVTMRLEALIAALLLLGDWTGSARADLRGLPQFSVAETHAIARNELLAAVIDSDPWLVWPCLAE